MWLSRPARPWWASPSTTDSRGRSCASSTRIGAAVAEAVRAEIIRQATARRKPAPGAPCRGRQPLPLRAHFDDPEPFEE
ncbi:MAG: hypothetical protein R2717_07255 [Schumannella sp.]